MIMDFYKDYIVANTAFVFGTDLFIGKDPDTPDQMVRLSNVSGFREDWQNEYGSDWVGIEVRCRGQMPQTETDAFNLHFLLDGYGDAESDDFKLITTRSFQEPQQVDIDDNGRVIFQAQYIAHVNWKDKTVNRTNLEPVIGA